MFLWWPEFLHWVRKRQANTDGGSHSTVDVAALSILVQPEHHSPLVQAREVASAVSVDRHQVAGKTTVEPFPVGQFDHVLRRMRQIGPEPSDLLRANRGPSDFYEECSIVVWKRTHLLLCMRNSFQVNASAVLRANSVEAPLKVHDRKLSDPAVTKPLTEPTVIAAVADVARSAALAGRGYPFSRPGSGAPFRNAS
jgi:hypothetical protein